MKKINTIIYHETGIIFWYFIFWSYHPALVQATFVFFCATSVVQIHFFNAYFIWLVTYYSTCFYFVVLIRNFKKLINLYIFEFDIKDDTFKKVRKMALQR